MKPISAAIFGLFVFHACLGQNTTANTAAAVSIGQKVTAVADLAGMPVSWYRNGTVAGRSYCVETGNVESPFFAETDIIPQLVVYATDGTTVITSTDPNSEPVEEPVNHFYPRACWVHTPAAGSRAFAKLVRNSGDGLVTLRWIETTLYCPWFFVAGDYNAFSLVRNTTRVAQNGVVVTWRGLNGTVAGTTILSIPASGTAIVNARDFVDPLLFSNGSIEIAHSGSPQALIGSTTTLSGSTGLGFDAKFEQRKTW